MEPRIAELTIRLQENPFFRPLDVGVVRQIAQHIQEVTFGIGDQLIKPEDMANDFFIIGQGHAKKEMSHVFGADSALRLLKPGDFFGHFSLIYQVPHMVSIVAMETIYLFKIPKDKFIQLYNEHPDFAAVFSSRVIRDGDFVDRVRSLSFFNMLTVEQLTQALPYIDVARYTDEMKLQEHYAQGRLLVIDSGEVQVTASLSGDLQKITLMRGNFITVLDEPREVSFKVASPATCFSLNETLLSDLVATQAAIKAFVDRSLIRDHVRRTSLFKSLPDNELSLLAWTVAQAVFEGGSYIYRQGDPGVRYFMVHKGKVEVRALNKDGKKPHGGPQQFEITTAEAVEGSKLQVMPQYVYGENELLFGLPCSKGLWALGRTELFFINRSCFDYVRKNNPQFLECISPIEENRLKLQFTGFEFEDKREDEDVIYACHRHWVSFVLSLITPPRVGFVRAPIAKNFWPGQDGFVVLFALLALFLWYSWSTLARWFSYFFNTTLLSQGTFGIASIGLAAVVLVVLWVWWNYLDWRNDYLVVTTKRVVRREKVVLLHEDQAQSELGKIEKIMTKAGFFGQMLGYCDLTIETAAADGMIMLDKAPQTSQLYNWLTQLPVVGGYLPKPSKIFAHNVLDSILKEQAERKKIMAIENDWGKLQGALRKQMGTGKKDAWGTAGVDKAPAPRETVWQKRWKSFQSGRKVFMDTVLPWRLRDVPDGTKKIWRKHWLNLTWRVADSLGLFIIFTLIILIYFGGFYTYLRFAPSLNSFRPILGYLNIIMVLTYVAIALRFWWEMADWSNDLYILTDKQVIDIEKKPLYFAEKRNQTELGKIQSISFSQRGLVDTLFNMGDVKIETAGGDPLIFRRVANPRNVQNEIFKQMDDVKSKARQKEAEDEVKKFTQWFDAYHNTFIRVN